jgi:L-2-hydroxycarboxylate dehydrogenase (NAD+)
MADNLPGEGIGHFMGAMRIDAFRPASEFKEHMDNWIETFRRAKVKKGEKAVLIPGDPEREMTEKRLKKGIPLLPPVEKDLEALAKKFSVKL